MNFAISFLLVFVFTVVAFSQIGDAQDAIGPTLPGDPAISTVISMPEFGPPPVMLGTVAAPDMLQIISNVSMPEFGPPPVILGTVAAPDMLQLISNPSVLKDLEVVDEQLARFQAMQAEWSNQIMTSMEGLRNGQLSGEQYTANLIARKTARMSVLNSTLLPHQISRLKQIVTQNRIKRFGTANAIADGRLAEALGLTERQKIELKDRAKELDEKLAEDIAKLKQKAQDDLLAVLTEEQRRELKRLTGERFESNPQDYIDSIPNNLRPNGTPVPLGLLKR